MTEVSTHSENAPRQARVHGIGKQRARQGRNANLRLPPALDPGDRLDDVATVHACPASQQPSRPHRRRIMLYNHRSASGARSPRRAHSASRAILLRPVPHMKPRLVRARHRLQPADPRQPHSLVPPQRRGNIVAAGRKARRQRRAVLDRLRRTLAHERIHRVARIPQQRRPADRPARQRIAIEQRPDEAGLRRADDPPDLRMPSVERQPAPDRSLRDRSSPRGSRCRAPSSRRNSTAGRPTRNNARNGHPARAMTGCPSSSPRSAMRSTGTSPR